MLKKLGVIGGMGPEATSFYYARVIARTKAESDQEHINMIILSHATMPDRTQAILTGNKLPFLKAITQDARDLEMLGVENIAIPCNTSHYFLEDIQKSTSVPIINMVEESVRYVVEAHPKVKKIGIMGTDGTMQAKTYHRACEKFGITPVVPGEACQKDVMSLIYDDIKKGNFSKFLIKPYTVLEQSMMNNIVENISDFDKDQKTSLRFMENSNFFTKELDEMLVQGLFRISIHSAKDLPNPLADGLELIALTKGLDPSDSLVQSPAFTGKGKIATS